ncbi:TRAP transporter large permease subunit [Chloroflexota bacterium]
MEWQLVLILIFGALILLMASGMPVAFAFIIICVVGAAMLWNGEAGLKALTLNLWFSVANFVFLPIPMFVFLGEVVFRSGMGMRAIDAMDSWLGRIPGRLGLLSVCVATLFSTMSGDTLATCAMLGETLTPEMERRGYKKPISIGAVMGCGGLAMLIPPSGLAVLWASIAEVSVGQVLIGGAIPGLIIAIFYATYIIGRCYFQRSMAPAYDIRHVPLSERLIRTTKYVLPLTFIMFMVTGLILLGIATPSESAVMGVISGFILAAAYRNLKWQMIKGSIISTLKITVFIFVITIGVKAFGNILASTGASQEMVRWVSSLAIMPILIIISMVIIILIMGMFIPGLPVMMITIPIFMPIVLKLGFAPVWFGILFLILIEMGQTTPPFGLLLFVMKAVTPTGTTMGEIVKAGIPFLICDAACVVIILALPNIVLWLPNIVFSS